SGKTQSNSQIDFLLLFEVAREYVHGDPNKDIHDYTYQARVCDDDISIEDSACSTFYTLLPTHDLNEDFKLVSMVDKKTLFFKGKIKFSKKTGDINTSKVIGKISVMEWKNGSDVKKYESFSGNINCISQSWVKLDPESNSNSHFKPQLK
ncbi:MAG: hypothetical protein PHY93_19690, partial [Bacteriovorax sp.]|nr:hypothetical protein [Bacteriovorax sp.]